MSPEGHGAQVLPDPDLGPKKVTPPTKSGAPCNYCFIKFLPKCTAEAPEAPQTPFMHPVPRGWGYRVETPQESSPLEDHLCAKFHPDPSSSLDFYREQTHRHCLYVLDLFTVNIIEKMKIKKKEARNCPF